MAFDIRWKPEARRQYDALRDAAWRVRENRRKTGREGSSPPEGLFKQVRKAIRLLAENPRHPGLETHEMHSLPHPYRSGEKVFTCHVQNRTPNAYRLFWCYGPEPGQITLISITGHP